VIDTVTPKWFERHTDYTFTVTTTSGMERIDGYINRVPDAILSRWRAIAIGVMALYTALWSIFITAYMLSWAVIIPWSLSSFSYDAQQSQSVDFIGILMVLVEHVPEFIIGAVVLLTAFIVFAAITSIAFLPGLALHELAHYIAIRDAGGKVDHYGLLFTGPVITGAFVEPEDESFVALPLYDRLAVFSVGVFHSLVWGTTLLLVGALFIGPRITESFTSTSTSIIPLLVIIGGSEIAGSLLNAAPGSKIDGGRFIQALEQDLLGYEDDMSLRERMSKFYTAVR